LPSLSISTIEQLQLQSLSLELTEARAEVRGKTWARAILSLSSDDARIQVLRLLQIEQKAQSDSSVHVHTLAKCESALVESRASLAQAMERLHHTDGLRVRKQLELEANKGDCLSAVEFQIIEANLQTAIASASQQRVSLCILHSQTAAPPRR
jgi:hypothetical protein